MEYAKKHGKSSENVKGSMGSRIVKKQKCSMKQRQGLFIRKVA